MNKYMELAIKEAYHGINHNHGGPFGAVIIKNNKIIAKGHNHVLSKHDPLCHGEIDAIRKACKKLKTHDLSGCILFTTAEPCHMCLCASMWANIDKIYYGCNISDTEIIGFRDEKFDKIFGGRSKLDNYIQELDRNECLKLFNYYKNIKHEKY